IFVAEQGGRLRVIKNGALLPTEFASVTTTSSGERGLLGIAFDPNFTSNQFVYVYYTATTPTIHNRVSRFIANGDVALAGSQTVILELNPLSGATNHNGGGLHFGLDGKLYIGVGENADGANGHGSGPTTGCAIAGGAFYNPAAALFPSDFIGDYFFADLCSGWIRRFDPASGVVTDFAAGFSAPVDLQVGADGGLYILSRGAG